MVPNSNNYYKRQQKHIQGVNLPSRIQCITCQKKLIEARFSQKSLRDYCGNIARYGQMMDKLPECKNCKGGNREELKCSDCDVVKSLEHFTKAQLKKADHAKCKDCQQDVDDRVPDVADALVEEEIKEEILAGRSNLSSLSYAQYSNRSSRPSNSNPKFGSYSYNARTASDAPSENGVYIPGDLDPGHVPLGTAGQPSNHHNRNNPRSRTQSIVSNTTSASDITTTTSTTTSTWADFPPDMARRASGNRAASGASRGANPGFVSLRAVPKDPETKLRAGAERDKARLAQEAEQRNTRSADSDDEDDDWHL